jgi:hypothetical protein
MISAIGISLGSASAVNAQDFVHLYSTLSQADPPYNSQNGWGILGSGFGPTSNAVASCQFTPTVTAEAWAVFVGMELINPATFTVTLALQANADGVPGAVLDTTTIQLTLRGTGIVSNALFDQKPLLFAGTKYWITAYEPNAGTSAEWYLNSNGTGATMAFNYTGTPNSGWLAQGGGAPAFDVVGYTVPEPGTFALYCAGVSFLGLRRRRKSGVPPVGANRLQAGGTGREARRP